MSKTSPRLTPAAAVFVLAALSFPPVSPAQARFPTSLGPGLLRLLSLMSLPSTGRALATPLPQSVLDILTDEISGQTAFNNEVILAGAPVLRDEKELTGTFFETQKIYDLARAGGLDNVKILRYPAQGTFSYVREAELWLTRPATRLLARLDADAALAAEDSASVDVTADLIYVPPPSDEQVGAWKAGGPQERFEGKVALMWSHPRREVAQALDAAGLAGVISFSSQDRYFDPDQVVYSGGSYGRMKNLRFGLTVSWRQWSELLEDIEQGRSPAVRCRVSSQSYPERIEGVLAWIPGTEPEKKGLIFTAHLFEGYTKRGANDDMSGCVAELEIARALTRLIAQGRLPAPQRTITFLWTNEIRGTFEHIRQNPGLGRTLSADINMDMVGEGLRKHNAVFILTEATNALPTYMDGLGRSILNYIWRTNDIVYLPDSPQSPRGEQVFPDPIWEKNGSRDAFRFDVQLATGASDHICFTNPSVAVPAVSLNVWPDQWYHTDLDTPDKSDPTQLKRVAFAGAAMAWAAANCDDKVLEGLADAAEEFGYSRIARRELPAALHAIRSSGPAGLSRAWTRAQNLLALAVERELGATETLADISSGSSLARALVADRVEAWTDYDADLQKLLQRAVRSRARELKIPPPSHLPPTPLEKKYDRLRPALTENVRGKEFRLEASSAYREYFKAHPDALQGLGLSSAQRRAVLDYINGRRSVTTIRDRAESETSTDMPLESVVRYIDFLKTIGWLRY